MGRNENREDLMQTEALAPGYTREPVRAWTPPTKAQTTKGRNKR